MQRSSSDKSVSNFQVFVLQNQDTLKVHHKFDYKIVEEYKNTSEKDPQTYIDCVRFELKTEKFNTMNHLVFRNLLELYHVQMMDLLKEDKKSLSSFSKGY